MNSGAGNIWSSLLEKRTILRWTVYFIFLPKISASHHKIQNDTFSQSYIYPIDHPWWSPVCINHPAFSPRLFQMTQYYEMKNLNLEHILVPKTQQNSSDWPEVHRQGCRSGWEMYVKSKMSESCLARWCWEKHLDFIN